MNGKQLLVLFLVLSIVTEEATAHTPLSVARWVGHWVTKPLKIIGGLPLLPIKHLAAKAIVAKKVAVVKAGLIAKPLLLKAALVGVAAKHGKSLIGGARTTVAPIARTTQMPLLRRLMPQAINFPRVNVPVHLSFESGKTQSRVTQMQEQIPTHA